MALTTLIFNPGETNQSLDVGLVDDVLMEGDEAFTRCGREIRPAGAFCPLRAARGKEGPQRAAFQAPLRWRSKPKCGALYRSANAVEGKPWTATCIPTSRKSPIGSVESMVSIP